MANLDMPDVTCDWRNLSLNWGNKLLAFHLDYKQAAKKDCTQGEEGHIWVVPWDMMSYCTLQTYPILIRFESRIVKIRETPPQKGILSEPRILSLKLS